MPHRLRKIRRQRGSRTVGWGKVGQHRRTGSKGRRNAGRHKALWSYVIKYEPEYYGDVGFVSPKSLKQAVKVINVGKLDEIAYSLSSKKEKGKLYVDLEPLGFTKLLGSGSTTKPMIVRVPSASKSAREKLKEAGGEVLLTLEEEEEEKAEEASGTRLRSGAEEDGE